MRAMPVGRCLFFFLLVGGTGLVESARAATCDVPSVSYPTVGAALRDGNCTTITLASGVYPENVTVERDVQIQGMSSVETALEGYLAVSGGTTDVTIRALTIDGTATGVAGCWREVLSVVGEAEVTTGPDVRVLQTASGGTACRLFADGFESGGSLAWSTGVP